MFLDVQEALSELRFGRMIIVVDDEDRENEGDLVAPAASVTPEQVNFIVTRGRGLVCVAIDEPTANRLRLPLMTQENTALHKTNFTVTVDAVAGTTTGISARDRAATIHRLADPAAAPEDFGRPGHISPIVARPGGVFRRAGHTEATVDLMRLAGLAPAGVLCEILDDDGAMARLPALERFAQKHGIGILTVQDVIEYRRRTEPLVKRILTTHLPTRFGTFDLHLYSCDADDKTHLALVKGDLAAPEPVLVRVHDQCLTGDVLGSLRCDCGPQLRYAMRRIEHEGRGVLLYLAQEGRGIGLVNKLKAYVLQEQGYDTVEANLMLGAEADHRDYRAGQQILADLGVRRMRLMTNNPRKIRGLAGPDLEIVEQIPIRVGKSPFNVRYLRTKKEKMGHLL